MPIMLKGLEGIRAHAGFTLGNSQWICVTDAMRSAFWLALDVQEDGAGDILVGKTHSLCQTANEFHALALLMPLLGDVFLLEDVVVSQSYAIQEVRFLAQVLRQASTGGCHRRTGASVIRMLDGVRRDASSSPFRKAMFAVRRNEIESTITAIGARLPTNAPDIMTPQVGKECMIIHLMDRATPMVPPAKTDRDACPSI
jgi:hypothetical protein